MINFDLDDGKQNERNFVMRQLRLADGTETGHLRLDELGLAAAGPPGDAEAGSEANAML